MSSASSPSRRKSFVEMAAKAAKGRRTTCTVICEIVEKSTDTMIDECSQLRGLATCVAARAAAAATTPACC